MMRSFMAARILLAAVAVVVLAWLGIALRDAILLQHGGDVLFRTPPPSQAEFDKAYKQMEDSDFLNPDQTGKIDRARFLLLHDDPGGALRLANQVVEDEPDNLAGWSVVYLAGQEVDQARAQQAVVAITRLDPVSAAKARSRR
jgi:hypothetical protein